MYKKNKKKNLSESPESSHKKIYPLLREAYFFNPEFF